MLLPIKKHDQLVAEAAGPASEATAMWMNIDGGYGAYGGLETGHKYIKAHKNGKEDVLVGGSVWSVAQKVYTTYSKG